MGEGARFQSAPTRDPARVSSPSKIQQDTAVAESSGEESECSSATTACCVTLVQSWLQSL